MRYELGTIGELGGGLKPECRGMGRRQGKKTEVGPGEDFRGEQRG